jgi:hypothetical protein
MPRRGVAGGAAAQAYSPEQQPPPPDIWVRAWMPALNVGRGRVLPAGAVLSLARSRGVRPATLGGREMAPAKRGATVDL